MYPREEAKIKQHTALKKLLCEIGEKAIWERRFTCFFYSIMNQNEIPNQKFNLIRIKNFAIQSQDRRNNLKKIAHNNNDKKLLTN